MLECVRGVCLYMLECFRMCRNMLMRTGLFTWQKRPIYLAKETYCISNRGLFTWQKRPIYLAQGACSLAKEAYWISKRGLLHVHVAAERVPIHHQCTCNRPDQKNNNTLCCVCMRIGLCIRQKRPMYLRREAYCISKRGLPEDECFAAFRRGLLHQ